MEKYSAITDVIEFLAFGGSKAELAAYLGYSGSGVIDVWVKKNSVPRWMKNEVRKALKKIRSGRDFESDFIMDEWKRKRKERSERAKQRSSDKEVIDRKIREEVERQVHEALSEIKNRRSSNERERIDRVEGDTSKC